MVGSWTATAMIVTFRPPAGSSDAAAASDGTAASEAAAFDGSASADGAVLAAEARVADADRDIALADFNSVNRDDDVCRFNRGRSHQEGGQSNGVAFHRYVPAKLR